MMDILTSDLPAHQLAKCWNVSQLPHCTKAEDQLLWYMKDSMISIQMRNWRRRKSWRLCLAFLKSATWDPATSSLWDIGMEEILLHTTSSNALEWEIKQQPHEHPELYLDTVPTLLFWLESAVPWGSSGTVCPLAVFLDQVLRRFQHAWQQYCAASLFNTF